MKATCLFSSTKHTSTEIISMFQQPVCQSVHKKSCLTEGFAINLGNMEQTLLLTSDQRFNFNFAVH